MTNVASAGACTGPGRYHERGPKSVIRKPITDALLPNGRFPKLLCQPLLIAAKHPPAKAGRRLRSRWVLVNGERVILSQLHRSRAV